jgi:hypothetical protein
MPEITNEAALESLDRKFALVRDRVTGVASGLSNGLYLYGSGGVGKSYAVISRLDQMGWAYKLFNSRMTAKGLFSALERAPDAVHILEDMERLTNDRDAQGVLRSSLWAQPDKDRIVTWTTATGGEQHFTFRGGVIMISNRPLAVLPELRALATRITVLRLDVTDAELTALLRRLAAKGHYAGGGLALESATCVEVTEFLLSECRAAGCPLDARLQVNSYGDYLLWQQDRTLCHWHDLVTSRVREAAEHFRHEVNRQTQEERHARLRTVVKEVLGQTPDVAEQIRLYRERTGKSRTDFYRRKMEIDSGEFE